MKSMTGLGIVRDEKAECSNSRFSSATPTRRGVARTIVGATFSAALGPLLGRGQAEAAKNRKRKRNDSKNRKRKKRDDKKGRQRPRGDAPLPPLPPPPSPPTGSGLCASDPTNLTGIAQVRRIAQTFLPPRGGRLTDAWVTLTENSARLNLTLDIRVVGPQGVPSNSVLASVQVVDIPQTDRGSFTRTVAAAFDPPVAITVGQRYALAVTGPDGQEFTLEGVDDDVCPGGELFRDDDANGVFYDVSADLVFAVTITD
jgi:hypothetical protein